MDIMQPILFSAIHAIVLLVLQTVFIDVERTTTYATLTPPPPTYHHTYLIGLPMPLTLYTESNDEIDTLAFFVMTSHEPNDVDVEITFFKWDAEYSTSSTSTVYYEVLSGKDEAVAFPDLSHMLTSPMQKPDKRMALVLTSYPIQIILYLSKATPFDPPNQPKMLSIASTQVYSTAFLGMYYTLPVRERKNDLKVYSVMLISPTQGNTATISLQTSIVEKNKVPWLTYNGITLQNMTQVSIDLGQYESFLVTSLFSMKGSLISFRDPAAVFIGLQNDTYVDVEQLLPISSTMSEYVTPYLDLPEPFDNINRYRGVAIKDETVTSTVHQDFAQGKEAYIPYAGDIWRMVTNPGAVITSSDGKPVQMLFYKPSLGPKWTPYFSTSLIPKGLWRDKYSWSIPAWIPDLAEHSEMMEDAILHLCIVIESRLRDKLRLDGSPIVDTDEFQTLDYIYFHGIVSTGFHTVNLLDTAPGETFSASMMGRVTNSDGSMVFFAHGLGLSRVPQNYLYTDMDPFPNSKNEEINAFPAYVPETTTPKTTATFQPSTNVSTTHRHNVSSPFPPKTTTIDSTTSPELTTDDVMLSSEKTTGSDDVSTTKTTRTTIACTVPTATPLALGINITQAQLEQILLDIRSYLSVDKHETSKALRRLISTPDPRMSSAGIGIVGIVICVTIITVIVLSDLITVTSFLVARLNKTFTLRRDHGAIVEPSMPAESENVKL